jgi:hypothetical protein
LQQVAGMPRFNYDANRGDHDGCASPRERVALLLAATAPLLTAIAQPALPIAPVLVTGLFYGPAIKRAHCYPTSALRCPTLEHLRDLKRAEDGRSRSVVAHAPPLRRFRRGERSQTPVSAGRRSHFRRQCCVRRANI